MNVSRVENYDFQIVNIENHSLTTLTWQGMKLYVLVGIIVFNALVGIFGEATIIFYIKKYSPEGRPINKLILVDQVSTKKWSLLNRGGGRSGSAGTYICTCQNLPMFIIAHNFWWIFILWRGLLSQKTNKRHERFVLFLGGGLHNLYPWKFSATALSWGNPFYAPVDCQLHGQKNK